MKYIIMCGGSYDKWDTPKHLTPLKGEPIVARTINCSPSLLPFALCLKGRRVEYVF